MAAGGQSSRGTLTVILVDSDWIIDGLSGREAALQTLASVSRQGVAVSTVTIAEVLVLEGAYLRPDPTAVHSRYRRFLEGYPVISVTSDIADTFARIRADLRRAGN